MLELVRVGIPASLLLLSACDRGEASTVPTEVESSPAEVAESGDGEPGEASDVPATMSEEAEAEEEDNGLAALGLAGTGRGGGERGGGSLSGVRQTAIDVEGERDPELMRRIVRAYINDVRACYDAGLERDPELVGTITLEYTVDAAGKVSGARAVEEGEALADAEVVACVVAASEAWTFVTSKTGEDAQVRHSFAFEPPRGS